MCVFLGFCVFEDVQETEWEEKNSVGTCETVNNQEFVCFCMQAGFDEYCEESSNCAITSSSDKWQGFQLNHLRLRSIAYDSRHVLKNRKLKIRGVKKDVYASVTVSHSRLFIFPKRLAQSQSPLSYKTSKHYLMVSVPEASFSSWDWTTPVVGGSKFLVWTELPWALPPVPPGSTLVFLPQVRLLHIDFGLCKAH